VTKKPKMSSTELGSLWMTYQKKTLILRIFEYFIEKSDDKKAKNLMSGLYKELHPNVVELKTMLQNEGAAVPIGFTHEDVNLDAPKLYENGFDIMFCRILKQISMGLYTLHVAMSYRKDIITLYREITKISQKYYDHFTQYLVEEKFLPLPTYVNMPKSVDYITDTNYMKGSNLFGHRRALNVIEFGYLYQSVVTNMTGMQLLTGFAQCAKNEEVKKYLIKGKELAKEIMKDTGETLLQNDIQPPVTSGGTVTNSTEAPFSEKLMMFCTYLLCNFGLGSNSFSAAFSLRNDLNVKTAVHAKDTVEYAREGVIIMISKGWLEEPPQMDH
jgi:hypothetical protein